MRYLKIENQGICDLDAILTLGISTTRESENHNKIGEFGSGAKQSICLFLRRGLNPIWYLGNLRIEFYTELKTVKSVSGEKNSFNMVFAKITGKDEDGKQINRTKELGFSYEFGKKDWNKLFMGVREIVSNAIDASFELKGNGSGYTVETVEENQVRAKAGHTRFFIQCSEEITEIYQCLPETFLIYKMDDVYENKILEKSDNGQALIYRRGVLVGKSNQLKSIFDYNLRDIKLDESRNVNQSDAETACGALIGISSPRILAKFLSVAKDGDQDLFENRLYTNELVIPTYCATSFEQAKSNWQVAFKLAFGEGAVATNNEVYYYNKLLNKGYKPIVISNIHVLGALEHYGIPTYKNYLDQEETKGIELFEPSEMMETCLNKVWCLLEDCFVMTNGKDKPKLKMFHKVMDSRKESDGFYNDGTVFINRSLSGSPRMQKIMIEQIANYVTEANSLSADAQDYAFDLISTMTDYILNRKAAMHV